MSLAQIHALEAAQARHDAAVSLRQMDVTFAAAAAAFMGREGARPMESIERTLTRIANG